MSEAVEVPVEEVEDSSPAIRTEVEVDVEDGSTTMTDAPEMGGDVTTIADSTETQDKGDSGEEASFPEFMQVLQELGIDTEKHEVGLKELAEKFDTLGITDFLNDPENGPEEVEQFIEETLVGAEDNPEEGIGKFEIIKALALEALGNLDSFANESTKDFFKSGMGRFIDALIRGAGNNSASSMLKHESENSADVVGSEVFFKEIRENPTKVISGLIENRADLKDAGWEIDSKGLEILKDGKNNPEASIGALVAVLVGENQSGITSLAEHLNSKVDHNVFWGRISPIFAKVFDKDKKMLSFNIKELLQKFGTGREDPTNGAYFGKANKKSE